MRKRRYPPGERIDRINKVLGYIASNPGCRRLTIGACMHSVYKSSLRSELVSEYLGVLLRGGLIKEKNGLFFITKEGEKLLRDRQAHRQEG